MIYVLDSTVCVRLTDTLDTLNNLTAIRERVRDREDDIYNNDLFSYQTVGIIHYDLPNGGTAGVRQVGVGMVDRQSTETCKRIRRKKSNCQLYSE